MGHECIIVQHASGGCLVIPTSLLVDRDGVPGDGVSSACESLIVGST